MQTERSLRTGRDRPAREGDRVERILGMCGLDCTQCEAWKATRAEDEAWKERIVEKWREEYASPEIPTEAATCDGCLVSGRQGGYCGMCPVRSCGLERGVEHCGFCEDYEACTSLGSFFAQFPGGAEASPAKINLDALRRGAETDEA